MKSCVLNLLCMWSRRGEISRAANLAQLINIDTYIKSHQYDMYSVTIMYIAMCTFSRARCTRASRDIHKHSYHVYSVYNIHQIIYNIDDVSQYVHLHESTLHKSITWHTQTLMSYVLCIQYNVYQIMYDIYEVYIKSCMIFMKYQQYMHLHESTLHRSIKFTENGLDDLVLKFLKSQLYRHFI